MWSSHDFFLNLEQILTISSFNLRLFNFFPASGYLRLFWYFLSSFFWKFRNLWAVSFNSNQWRFKFKARSMIEKSAANRLELRAATQDFPQNFDNCNFNQFVCALKFFSCLNFLASVFVRFRFRAVLPFVSFSHFFVWNFKCFGNYKCPLSFSQ